MIITHAVEQDIEEISILWEAMVNELLPGNKPNIIWWQEICRKLINTDIYNILIAREGNKIIGFIDAFIFPEPSTGKTHGVAQHFYIMPIFRCDKLSGKLYREILKIVKSKGAEVYEFFCDYNNQSIWKKKGYSPVRVMMRR